MKRAKILVVDNEPLIGDLLMELFSRDGHRVFLAANAGEALELCETTKFDWIISDVDMPGKMDGIDFIKAIRAKIPNQQVIMMTGNINLHEARLKELKTVVYNKPLGDLDIMARVVGEE